MHVRPVAELIQHGEILQNYIKRAKQTFRTYEKTISDTHEDIMALADEC